jgi:hypothetical protein
MIPIYSNILPEDFWFQWRATEQLICFEICTLLGYYAAYSGNSLPTFRDNLQVPSSSQEIQVFLDLLTLEDGKERLSRNVGKELPLYAA